MMFLLRWVHVGVAMLSLAPPPTTSFSRGASPASCQGMTPGHIRAHPQDPRHGYVSVRTSASSYRPGQLVTVTVRSSRDFMGFLLQARGLGVGNRSMGGEPVLLGGTWALTPPGAHTLRCLSEADAVTHSDKQLKRNLSFVWRAPDAPKGDVRFYITVVQSYFVYWANIESAVLRDGSHSSPSVRNQARETFTISVPPALRVVKDPNNYKTETNEETTGRSPTRQSTGSHLDVSTKTQVSPVALEDIRVSSLTTLTEEPSGVTEEGRTKDTGPPTVQEGKDLIRELEGLVTPRWIGPTKSQTGPTTTDGTHFKISSPNQIRPSRAHVPLFRSHVATEDDPPSRQSRGTPSGLKTSPSQTLVLLSSSAPPPFPDGSHVFPGTDAPQTVHDAHRDRPEQAPEPWTKPFPFTNRQTQNPPLFPNGTLNEGSDDGKFLTSPEATSLAFNSVSSDTSSASSHFDSSSSNSLSSSSFASSSSSVGSSCPTSESSYSPSTTNQPRAALIKPPTPPPINIPAHRLPVQASSTNPQRPTEGPSPLSSTVSSSTSPGSSALSSLLVSSTSLVPSLASIHSTSPRPGPSPVPRRSLNAASASSPIPLASRKPAADPRLITHQVATSDPNRTPSRTAVHLNPKPHPNLKVHPGHGAKPNVPNGKPKPAPEAPDKEGKYPDIVPRHSDWELGMLLGCSAGLGMVLVVALRYVYRQACGRRTGVTLNDREREYTRGERGLIHVQECGDLVRVRKIRENSFVLLAEYDILATPAD